MAVIYDPVDTGIHVCGFAVDDGYEVPATVANFPLRSAADARDVFRRAKVELFCPDDPDDLIVDLMLDGSREDDFHLCMQHLNRLRQFMAQHAQ